MAWRARWRHVSQLYRHNGDGPGVVEGANDCFEACLARYLREMEYPFSGDDAALIGSLRLLATGQPDHAGQGYTTLEQGGHALAALGIPWRWTSDPAQARAAAWAIYWVRAGRLRRTTPVVVDGRSVYTDYPLWWLGPGDSPDHFILRLPGGRFNDPLSYWNGGRDTDYTATSVAASFGGAYVLDGPPRLSHAPGNGSATSGTALVVTSADGLHLRQAPVLTAPVLATLRYGDTMYDAYEHECLWTFVRAGELHGWVRREYTRRA